MMKELLYKELKLSMHPTVYIFLFLCSMLLIPNYPYYVAFLYISLSIFFIFLSGRENKDIYFSVSLPIRKRDIVKARFYIVAIIELAQVIFAIPFAVLRNAVIPHGNAAGIEANVAFFGFVFVMYSLFNVIFLPMFYKTAYKVGVPLVFAMTAIVIYIGAIEAAIQLIQPLKSSLDTLDPDLVVKQVPVLIAGIVIYLLSMILAYKKSANCFEKIDL